MLDFKLLEKDIEIINPNIQQRYTMVKIVNQSLNDIATIHGRVISGNVTIDATSETRRSGSVSMIINPSDINKVMYLNTRNYIRLYWGIKNPKTSDMQWYRQGTFIITQNSLTFDPQTRTLNMSLSDLMTDLTGERKGTVYGYSTVAKNEQRIDQVVENLMKLAGVIHYDILPISPFHTKNVNNNPTNRIATNSLMVPYDLKFETGATIHDILEQLVGLYPGYEMLFNKDGKFIIQRQTLRENASSPVVDDAILGNMILSEDKSYNVLEVKNAVDIWGKDGLYYGHAEATGRDNMFDPHGIGIYRYAETKDDITDRYMDTEKVKPYLDQQAKCEQTIADLTLKQEKEGLTSEEEESLRQARRDLTATKDVINANVCISGNDLCEQWAEYKLDQLSRLNDSITIHCIGIPCLNEAGIKISHKSRFDAHTGNFIIQSISHDLGNNTTDITAIRSYGNVQRATYYQLNRPTITRSLVSGMTVAVTVTPVEEATNYYLYLDGMKVGESHTPTITAELPADSNGKYVIEVAVGNDDENNLISNPSVPDRIEVKDNILVDSEGNYIATKDGDHILLGR